MSTNVLQLFVVNVGEAKEHRRFSLLLFPTPAIGHLTPICLYPLLFKDKPGVSAEEARGA